MFIAGTVNPNGPEDCGGLLAWTALAALVLLLLLGLAAMVFLTVRPRHPVVDAGAEPG